MVFALKDDVFRRVLRYQALTSMQSARRRERSVITNRARGSRSFASVGRRSGFAMRAQF